MKKGCLIVLIVLAILLAAAVISGLVAFRIANERLGIRLAPTISHEEYATSETRIRLQIRPELMTAYIVDFLPADVALPTANFELQEILHHVVPREIALLARSDIASRRMRFTIFVNEKRGGPIIVDMINDLNPFENVPKISWNPDRLALHGRGTLVLEGSLPIPGDVEDELLEIWPTRSPHPPAAITGVNDAELIIDNMNGDILALAATIAAAADESWADLRKDQMADMVMGIIETIHVLRLAANVIRKDAVELALTINADAQRGPGLQFLLAGMVMPHAIDYLRNELNLTLTGDIQWDEGRSAIIGNYTLSGLEALIQEHLKS